MKKSDPVSMHYTLPMRERVLLTLIHSASMRDKILV